MGDFLKIFFIVCAMAVAFFVGKGYGEQTFFASEDYKNIAKTREELDYARSELENAKVKLQNIINGAERQKTDELLAQILQVFLADLGLQIQNRDLILQQAKTSAAATPVPNEKAPEKNIETAPALQDTLRAEAKENLLTASQMMAQQKPAASEKKLGQLKSDEWLLLNSDYNKKLLKKVRLRDIGSYLANANPEISNCEAFIGKFKGGLKGQDGSDQGSLSFELRNDNNLFSGKISWMNSPNPPIAINISGNCGLTASPLMARIFTLSDTIYLQVYPIGNGNELAGNMYEKRPGNSYPIGTFRIRRLSI